MKGASAVRTAGVDGLRAFAALVVFGFHTWLFAGWNPQLSLFHWQTPLGSFSSAGYLGVDIFFVVSGFCLYLPFARAQRNGTAAPSLSDFYIARVLKIVPSYYIVLAITAGLSYSIFSHWDFWHIVLAHVVFIQNSGTQLGYWNSVLWSLGVEVQFYVVFPLIAYLARRNAGAVFTCMFIAAYAYRQAAFGCCQNDESITRELPAYLDLFASGMIAAIVLSHIERFSDEQRALMRKWASFAAVLAILSLCAQFQFVAAITPFRSGREMWNEEMRLFVGAGTAWLLICTCVTPIERLFASRPLRFISMISYNVYLWHTLVELLFLRFGVSAKVQGALNPVIPPGIAFWLLGALATLTVSTLVTYFIERPILSLRRHHTFSYHWHWKRRTPRAVEAAYGVPIIER